MAGGKCSSIELTCCVVFVGGALVPCVASTLPMGCCCGNNPVECCCGNNTVGCCCGNNSVGCCCGNNFIGCCCGNNPVLTNFDNKSDMLTGSLATCSKILEATGSSERVSSVTVCCLSLALSTVAILCWP